MTQKSGNKYSYQLQFADLGILLPALILGIMVSWLCIRAPNYWWYLAMGRIVEQSGSPLSVNGFLYTLPHDSAFIDLPWLAEWILYKGWNWFGHAGLKSIGNVWAIVVWAWVGWLTRRRGTDVKTVVVHCSAMAVVVFPMFEVRTRLLVLPLFVALWEISSHFEWTRRPRLLWLVVPITILWANLHGSFPIAPLFIANLVGAEILEDAFSQKSRQTESNWKLVVHGTAAVLVAILAAGLHPAGLTGVYTYVADIMYFSRSKFSTVESWQALSLFSTRGPVVYGLMVFGAFIMYVKRESVRLYEVVFWGLTAYLAINSLRMFFWWAVTTVVVVSPLASEWAGQISDWPRESVTTGKKVLLGVLILGLTGGWLAYQPWVPGSITRLQSLGLNFKKVDGGRGLLCKKNSVELVDRLQRRGYPGRIFHDQRVAGLLELKIGAKNATASNPEPKPITFLDQRMRIIPEKIRDDYWTLSLAKPGWEQIIETWNIETLLLAVDSQQPLIKKIQDKKEWELRGRTKAHRLYFRSDQ